MKIRPEQSGDYSSVLKLTYKAFLTLNFPGRRRIDEHYLVSLLRGSGSIIPELCFVVEQDNEIVGHILYTRSEVMYEDGSVTPTVTFGPLSVMPEYQRQGIGSALVKHSLDVARILGYCAVIITGVPDYYPKLGFRRAREYRLTLPDGSSPDAFMVFELIPGALNGGGKARFLAPEFEQAETDDKGFENFHRSFMRENYGGRLIIRPYFESDARLLEKWLYQPHVARWYEHPEDWLIEIANRYGEFNFIKHFIAEVDGRPIGFCQYYDCYFGQEHEDWYRTEKPGELFSIDYLIGEPQALRKGYGSEMVRILTSTIRNLGAKKVIVQPDEENTASRRALEANGYRTNGEYYAIEFDS